MLLCLASAIDSRSFPSGLREPAHHPLAGEHLDVGVVVLGQEKDGGEADLARRDGFRWVCNLELIYSVRYKHFFTEKLYGPCKVMIVKMHKSMVGWHQN